MSASSSIHEKPENKMKVAILTQPLGHNYGGLLQAFALQRLLESVGYQVETIDRRSSPSLPLKLKITVRHYWAYCTGKAKFPGIQRSLNELNKNLLQFRAEMIALSPQINSSEGLREYIIENGFSAIVVGSDQVWRPRFSPSLKDFFLEFATDIEGLKRISYAASFGVDDFDVPNERLHCFSGLLAKFDGVSVRELSGVAICREKLNYPAAKVLLDPTLYFDQSFYRGYSKKSKASRSEPYIATYLLDATQERARLVSELAQRAKLPSRELMHAQTSYFDKDGMPLPAVEDWLADFENAEYVITDSFHGCVFAIIFNKKFIAIGNSMRGLDRFESLLTLFCLSERLIRDGSLTDYDTIYAELDKNVDWEEVELIRASQKDNALSFISAHFPSLTADRQGNELRCESGDE
ncbi:polysaccharide pyruvyl transferase family protein [Pseudidiomarina sp. 1APP75-32.1]|uniref:Polysaccharide pyruvyl transferase family protein n=1 Tax=Pseudidiomarina terrestris TaxID=2820060 RepID=A0AAW7R026_9GAMM|nr:MULTISPECIES: polysaccharide pyruvyl transferase family protein [unclassified Pseudidiomarina]MDN7124485.1 polysaccharide pyruvyl transferase family protein [Pseudidiomarina sp. 1APP75-32.1]MDN7129224.1 polysaccharide pyruvyl transferase family protein [Pseudidiomarina sp. 1APR75-15]